MGRCTHLSLPGSGGTKCHVKLKALVVIWKLSLGFGSVFCLCTSIYWDLWCKESFKVQPYLWESPLFFPTPPLVETGQGSCAGVRELLEHLAEAALPFRFEALGNAASTVLICLRRVMSHVSSFTLFLHTTRFSSVFPMFVSFDVSCAIEWGGLQREAAEFIHAIALLVCEA